MTLRNATALAAAILLIAIGNFSAHSQERPQERVALVIGNGAYKAVPALPNPVNDAADIAASLDRLGFKVRRVTDATLAGMRRAVLEFSTASLKAEMAVVFYAGHGIEAGGENWLIPTDATLKSDADIEREAVTLRSLVIAVSNASRLGLIMLDACRNNPFATKMLRTSQSSSVERGFVKIEPASGVLVAYAARDGTTASDGAGRNSPFTSALLKHIETPGLEINFLFRHVRDDVYSATNREQEPFVYGALSREAIFLKAPAAPKPVPKTCFKFNGQDVCN